MLFELVNGSVGRRRSMLSLAFDGKRCHNRLKVRLGIEKTERR